jgi:hypothetical protein
MKTIKKVFLLALLVFIQYSLLAQNNRQDVVYLKNGGITRGTIIELIPEKQIKIETFDGNVFVYQMSEIEKYAKEPTFTPKLQNAEDNTGIKRGYYGVLEFGTGFSFGALEGPLRNKINIINGYRINPWLAAGAGFGVRFYPGDEILLPFFADLRVNFLNKKTSPYVSMGIGYAFSPSEVDYGGLLLTPTFGISVKLKKRNALNLGLSYEAQGLNYKYYDYYDSYNQVSHTEYSHTISFQLGVLF